MNQTPSQTHRLLLSLLCCLTTFDLGCGDGSEARGEGGPARQATRDGGADDAAGDTSDAGNARGDAGPTRDADGGGGALEATWEEFCGSGGPTVALPGASGPACTGSLAQTAFRYAICSCDRLLTSRAITTDSFDSHVGTYDAAMAGDFGSVGVNGVLQVGTQGTPETLHASGALWVGSESGVQDNGNVPNSMDISVGGSMRAAGPVQFGGALQVGADAFVDGNVEAMAIEVGGTLSQPGGTSVVAASSSFGGQETSPVSVAPPCSCGQNEVIDVAALVGAAADNNDNAAASFDPGTLSGYADGARIELPCGRLHVPEVKGTGALTLVATGRTALFVRGDLEPGGDFRIELDGAGAELDLFVQGTLTSAAHLTLGSIAEPSRVRLYVGGSAPIFLSGGGVYAGNIYAPNAQFTISTESEIYGSLFADGIVNSDLLTVHYDEAILRAGDDCEAPPSCDSCLDCGNQACVNGACGACETDADCCAPLTCFQGECLPRVL